jgi:hypothetical protein
MVGGELLPLATGPGEKERETHPVHVVITELPSWTGEDFFWKVRTGLALTTTPWY